MDRPRRTLSDVAARGWRIGLVFGLMLVPAAFLADQLPNAVLRPDAAPRLMATAQWITWLGYGLVDVAIPVVLGVVARCRGELGGARRGVLGGAAVAIAGLLDQFLKNVLCRARPSGAAAGAFFHEFPCFPAPYALASFPSGHATTVFALAAVLSLWYPRGTVAWLALAAVVGWSRIALGSHFPSDVVAGAVLGVAVTLAFFRWVPGTGMTGEPT